MGRKRYWMLETCFGRERTKAKASTGGHCRRRLQSAPTMTSTNRAYDDPIFALPSFGPRTWHFEKPNAMKFDLTTNNRIIQNRDSRIQRLIFRCIVLLFLATACNSDDLYDPIPLAFVDITLNMDTELALRRSLDFPPNFAYLDGGLRGIILYKDPNNEYHTFERNCSFEPTSTCADVEVDQSGLFLFDACCGSTFDWQGYPDPASPAEFRLREYPSFFDGTYLIIRSEN